MAVLFEERDGALLISIQVIPRASRASVGPARAERLRVAVNAPPVDGAANIAVVEALAAAFGVRRAQVTIIRGERGRQKTVRVLGADRATLQALAGGNPRPR